MMEIFKLFSQNKKTLALIIGMGLIFSLATLHFAYAQQKQQQAQQQEQQQGGSWWLPWEILADVVNQIFDLLVTFSVGIVVAMITVGIFILAVIFGFVFFLVGGIFAEFIKDTLSVMVVPGKAINVVTAGWTFSRDFANMFLILILAIIGLATILKLRDYEAKKMLPMVLIVILLINFSGTLVGFVVDIGNLVTDFFIKEFTGGGFNLDSLKEDAINIPYEFLINTIFGIFSKPFGSLSEKLGIIIGSVIYGLALLLFFISGIWILCLIMLVFFVRVLVLWVLTILAPIAFLSRALPSTPTVKRLFPSVLHWDEWWEKLIQWTIIGIPIGFFLVLSRVFFIEGVDYLGGLEPPQLSTDTDGNLDKEPLGNLNKFIAAIFAPSIGLILMSLGVFISMKTAPPVAQEIIKAGAARGRTIIQAWVTGGAKAVGKKVKDIGKAVGKEVKDIGNAFGAQYLQRGKWWQVWHMPSAIKETTISYWGERVRPALGPKPVKEAVWRGVKTSWRVTKGVLSATTKGVLSATKDVAKSGILTGLQIKKLKERPTCPECGNYVPSDARFCPHCQYKMPTCSGPESHVMGPGVPFCHICGSPRAK